MAAGGTAVIVFTLALVGALHAADRVLQKKGIEGHMRPAYRRYTMRFLPAMFGYVIFLMGAIYYWKRKLTRRVSPPGWWVSLHPCRSSSPFAPSRCCRARRTMNTCATAPTAPMPSPPAACSRSVRCGASSISLEVVPHVQLWAAFPIWAVCLAIAQCMPHLRPKAGGMKNELRVLRAKRNWSQGDLADALGISRQSVNALETGKHDPSLPLAFRIARLFGKRVDEIFDDGLSAFSKAAE